MNHPTLPEAIKVLQNALTEDKEPGSYYHSWQSNIAMAFVDEYNSQTEVKEMYPHQSNGLNIPEIANEAAKNFLDSFCNQ